MSEKENNATSATQQESPTPKKSRRNRFAIIGVVAAVIVVAGVGFFVWHEQPSFCNALCHTSMDAYVATYDNESGQAGTDKYGDEVSDAHAMLVASHEDQELACLDCHVPAITQQIGEVMETVTGDYEVVARADGNGAALHEVGTVELMENSGHGTDGDAFCLRSGCHAVTRDQLTEETSDRAFNPHRWQHEEFECSDWRRRHFGHLRALLPHRWETLPPRARPGYGHARPHRPSERHRRLA